MKKISIHKKVQRRAFSLIELSAVLMVVGLLIVGIAAGSAMFKVSRPVAARALTMQSPVSTIPDLVAWYESSTKESFVAGQNVEAKQLTSWFNREPSGFLTQNSLTATATSTYKETSINNIPAINFNGGKAVIANFSGSTLATSTVIIVFKPTATIVANTFYTIADAGASANSVSSISITNNRVRLDASTSPVDSSTVTNPAAFVTNGTYILVVYFNGASSKVFVNNITEVGGLGATLSPGTNALDGLTIGANKSGASGIAAEISEVIVYGRVLKDTERQDVMSYLSKKYQITVTGL